MLFRRVAIRNTRRACWNILARSRMLAPKGERWRNEVWGRGGGWSPQRTQATERLQPVGRAVEHSSACVFWKCRSPEYCWRPGSGTVLPHTKEIIRVDTPSTVSWWLEAWQCRCLRGAHSRRSAMGGRWMKPVKRRSYFGLGAAATPNHTF